MPPPARSPRSDVDRLYAVHRAALAIGGDIDLDRTLRRILRTAARLVGARYGALGIRDESGGFGTFLTVGISRRRADLIGGLPRLHGLLGTILREGRSVRLADVRRHRDFSYYPEHHPEMREFLGVPIAHRGDVLGELFFSGTVAAPFTAADQRLVEMLAAHAGIAIATARLAARERELATLRERDRLGHQIQKAVSQALVGMIAEARAGAGRASDPNAARASLGALEQRATAALGEVQRLTVRELDVLRLMADGRSNKEIAQELSLSDKTVKTHVSSVLGKLGVSDRTQAAVLAVRSGLVE
jgi:DNA-binding CsgD family transcriptional regulator